MNEATSLSLLQRAASARDADSWERLAALYEPLMRRWLGVDDRVGVTTADLDWKLLEKTDIADQYPAATLIVPNCHIEGNGTAWFDDLEVIAYDREKLPNNFDATHGKNNRTK